MQCFASPFLPSGPAPNWNLFTLTYKLAISRHSFDIDQESFPYMDCCLWMFKLVLYPVMCMRQESFRTVKCSCGSLTLAYGLLEDHEVLRSKSRFCIMLETWRFCLFVCFFMHACVCVRVHMCAHICERVWKLKKGGGLL